MIDFKARARIARDQMADTLSRIVHLQLGEIERAVGVAQAIHGDGEQRAFAGGMQPRVIDARTANRVEVLISPFQYEFQRRSGQRHIRGLICDSHNRMLRMGSLANTRRNAFDQILREDDEHDDRGQCRHEQPGLEQWFVGDEASHHHRDRSRDRAFVFVR